MGKFVAINEDNEVSQLGSERTNIIRVSTYWDSGRNSERYVLADSDKVQLTESVRYNISNFGTTESGTFPGIILHELVNTAGGYDSGEPNVRVVKGVDTSLLQKGATFDAMLSGRYVVNSAPVSVSSFLIQTDDLTIYRYTSGNSLPTQLYTDSALAGSCRIDNSYLGVVVSELEGILAVLPDGKFDDVDEVEAKVNNTLKVLTIDTATSNIIAVQEINDVEVSPSTFLQIVVIPVMISESGDFDGIGDIQYVDILRENTILAVPPPVQYKMGDIMAVTTHPSNHKKGGQNVKILFNNPPYTLNGKLAGKPIGGGDTRVFYMYIDNIYVDMHHNRFSQAIGSNVVDIVAVTNDPDGYVEGTNIFDEGTYIGNGIYEYRHTASHGGGDYGYSSFSGRAWGVTLGLGLTWEPY